jgi:hypothetical protein
MGRWGDGEVGSGEVVASAEMEVRARAPKPEAQCWRILLLEMGRRLFWQWLMAEFK